MRLLLLLLQLTTACVAQGTIERVDEPTDDPVADTATYQATLLATALDRLVVTRTDVADDTCAFLILAHPMDRPEWATQLEAPERWALEWGGARRGVDCDPQVQLPTAYATRAWGWITWQVREWDLPAEIDMDVVLRVDDGREVRFAVQELEASW